MTKTNRRNFFKKAGAVAPAVALGAAGRGKAAAAQLPMEKKVHYRNGRKPNGTPLFSPAVSYGNLLFLSGVGYHQEGDIKTHTTHVLDQIEETLKSCGSSMEKVLQARVFLNDLKDYQGMNEVFKGRFGPEPPVRTTIAAAGGIPGNSLVEIDVVAYI